MDQVIAGIEQDHAVFEQDARKMLRPPREELVPTFEEFWGALSWLKETQQYRKAMAFLQQRQFQYPEHQRQVTEEVGDLLYLEEYESR